MDQFTLQTPNYKFQHPCLNFNQVKMSKIDLDIVVLTDKYTPLTEITWNGF